MAAAAKNGLVLGLRLLAATVLTPLVMTIWLCLSIDTVMAYFGANPDGPAKLVLGMMVLMIGFAVPLACLLCFGLPYVCFKLAVDRFNFRAGVLPMFLVAIAYSLLVYVSMQPNRHPGIALATALATLPGVFVAGLRFYFVGVWRTSGPRRNSPAAATRESCCQ
jgi:hypothetical protein